MPKNVRDMLQQFSDKLTYKHWLIVAGAVSCVLGILVYLSLGSSEPEKLPVQPIQKKTVKVLAAKTDIPPRAIINDKMLSLIELPEDTVPEGAVSDIRAVVNNPAAIIIMKGDIITKKKIMSDPKMAGFVGMIPADCRAVSVGISDVTGVAGFAVAGDYVDVMVVTGRKEDGRLIGRLLLQNVLLLGINKSGGNANEKPAKVSDDKSGDKNSDGTVKASKESMATATLALTPDDALRLATTAQNGIVYLTLRPYKPKNEVVATQEYIVNTEQRKAPANPAGASAPAAGRHAPSSGSGPVEVIRGTTATREGGR